MIRDLENVGIREDTAERTRMSQTPRHLDKREKFDLEMIALDTIKLEEIGKEEGLVTYEKVWAASDLDHYIDMPHYFQVGLFNEAIIRRQEKAMEILVTVCGDVSTDRTWMEESINFIKFGFADIEEQGVSHSTEWKDHVWSEVGQVKVTEIFIKALQQELIELTNSSIKYDDELKMIFNSSDTFQYFLQKYI